MYFSCEIESDHEGMTSVEDLVLALKKLTQHLESDILDKKITLGSIIDANDTTIGHWVLKK